MCRICYIKSYLSVRYIVKTTYREWEHIAESGLSRKRVLIWIYEGELSIEYQRTVVARYRCEYDPKQQALQGLSEPTLYQTCFTPPQLELIELDDEQWVKFQRRPSRTRNKRIAMQPQQLPLLDLGASA